MPIVIEEDARRVAERLLHRWEQVAENAGISVLASPIAVRAYAKYDDVWRRYVPLIKVFLPGNVIVELVDIDPETLTPSRAWVYNACEVR